MNHPHTITTTLSQHQKETVLAALDDAAEARRERAGSYCEYCSMHVAGVCEDHAADLDRVSGYENLAGQLAGSVPAGPGPVLHVAGWWQSLLGRAGLTYPRALCGTVLAVQPGRAGPGPGAPVCPWCAVIAGDAPLVYQPGGPLSVFGRRAARRAVAATIGEAES